MYQIIGAYKITPTEQSICDAACYHGADFLLDEQGSFIDPIVWEDFQNLVLIEVQVMGHFSPNILMNASQNDQAPYMEFYLDQKGSHLIPDDEIEEELHPRVLFFLHFFEPTQPIFFDDQPLECPLVSGLPERLKPFTHYIPVD